MHTCSTGTSLEWCLCILCGSTALDSPLKKTSINQPIVVFFFVFCFLLAVSVQGCLVGVFLFRGSDRTCRGFAECFWQCLEKA